MRVGLFFGSFDPPHIGHVNVVMGAINSSQVGRVLVIPAYQNLWKESSSKFSYRYAMSCMQFDTLPFVHVSDVEKIKEICKETNNINEINQKWLDYKEKEV